LYEQILQLFGDHSEISFEEVALQVFLYQSRYNPVYKEYLELIKVDAVTVESLEEIPLMPIDFYKHREVKTGDWPTERLFLSSGTTNQPRSKHHLRSSGWYVEITRRIFQEAGFNLSKVKVLGLLPNYLEAGQSSLVHMVNDFVNISETAQPQFFLYDHAGLHQRILELIEIEEVILFGVTFALLDFANAYQIDSSKLKIIFTGGMKNRQEELMHDTIVERLKVAFPASPIHSEYGMTELLSQAYADEKGRYRMPSTMQVIPKEINDPFSNAKPGKTGMLGIMDMGNIDTLSFVLTQDLGRVYPDSTFEVMGRISDSDLRGCNLLYNPIV